MAAICCEREKTIETHKDKKAHPSSRFAEDWDDVGAELPVPCKTRSFETGFSLSRNGRTDFGGHCEGASRNSPSDERQSARAGI